MWAVGSYSSGPPAGGTFVLISTEYRNQGAEGVDTGWSISKTENDSLILCRPFDSIVRFHDGERGCKPVSD